MGFLSRLFQGSELARAQGATEVSRERAEEEARTFERWLAALRVEDGTTQAGAKAHLQAAAAAEAKDDLPGLQEACEQLELARAAYCKGRAALARAHPLEAALLLLGEASEVATEIRDLEDRSARAGQVAQFQAACGDVAGARRTLENVSEPADQAGVARAIAIARAGREALDPARLERELATAGTDDWNHEEVLLAIVEDRCQRGDVAGAKAMLAPIEEPDLQAQALRFLAATEARRGRLEEARAIAGGIEHADWSAAAWSDIAGAQAASGDLAGAQKTAESIQDEGWRSTARGVVAGALAQAGDDAGAAQLVERITDPELRDDALLWIAEGRARRRDFTGAVETLAGIQDELTRARELVALAEAAQAAGQAELAGDLLARAIAAAEELRAAARHPHTWLAQFLVDARSRLAEFEGAEAVLGLIDDERRRFDLLASLAFHAARHPTGGLVALEDLQQRHPGVLERLAILQHGARGFLATTEAKTAQDDAPPPATGTHRGGAENAEPR